MTTTPHLPERLDREAVARDVDSIVTALYRRFKDWSRRGFGPDDVTWCEVKADVLRLMATGAPERSEDGPSAEVETYREMHRIATEELGYPSILEALEATPRASEDGLRVPPSPKEAAEEIAALWREERDRLRAALRKIKAAATLVTEWLDRINDRDGSALGGPQWFELGRAIAKADEALAEPQREGQTNG